MAIAVFLAGESTQDRMAGHPGISWAVLTLPEWKSSVGVGPGIAFYVKLC